jgi:hypothetical protein
VFSILTLASSPIYSQSPVIKNIFMQGNNINTVFRTDGVFNYDRVSFTSGVSGLVWPASSYTRKTLDFASGLWIAAKVGPQQELRNCCAFYISQYTPGNIPVIGEVPPSSVCTDTSWRGYKVNLTDPELVNGGIRVKMAGGRSYKMVYDSWNNWPVSKGAPYVEVNGIPGYQPGWNSDRPGIGNSISKPDEILFMVYMDYTHCTNDLHQSEISLPGGTRPLGAEIQQLTFVFNCSPLQNMYFVKWKIINKSSLIWDSVYISLSNETDIGNAADDASGCDSTRNLGFIYNADSSDNIYGVNPPALGTRLLQGPLKHTGNPNDTARLPYGTLIGYKLLGMTSDVTIHNTAHPCLGDPYNAASAYNFMRGFDGCGNSYFNWVTGQYTKFIYPGDACRRLGWFDSVSTNVRYMQNSGPFTMNSGDTQTIVMAFVIGSGSNNFQNVCNVQTLSDSARKYYYDDFPVCFPIGIEQTSSLVPERFALYQNYPNPFNPSTKIKFSVPFVGNGRDRSVELKVYDVLGRLVATLVNQPLAPGTYEVDFNGTNYPSGVYFYKITANEFSESKRMILMK